MRYEIMSHSAVSTAPRGSNRNAPKRGDPKIPVLTNEEYDPGYIPKRHFEKAIHY